MGFWDIGPLNFMTLCFGMSGGMGLLWQQNFAICPITFSSSNFSRLADMDCQTKVLLKNWNLCGWKFEYFLALIQQIDCKLETFLQSLQGPEFCVRRSNKKDGIRAMASPPVPKRVCSQSHLEETDGLRKTVSFSTRRWNPSNLPADMLRVYTSLKERFDEEYACLFVFNMQTAMEMHRAWNMTLLTSKTLKKCSEMVGLTMTWELGVIKLKFFMEDGDFELQRKVAVRWNFRF